VKARKMAYGPIATRKIYDRMRSMQVGEEFALKRSEWRVATSPVDSIGKSAMYKHDYTVRELADGTGWVIARVK
jgi:hypothetical protein